MTDRVIHAIRSMHAAKTPFFLTAFYSSTHIPYAVPYPYYKIFTDPAYQGIHKYGFGIHDPREIKKAMAAPPEADQLHIQNLYDGGIAAFDEAVGNILAELDRLDIRDETLILVTSDHGENIYDHGNLLEHGERFGGGDAANRIPLILRNPDHDLKPRRVSSLVSILDVLPTLLGLLSLPVPDTARGRDLGPLLEGAEMETPPVFAETGLWLAGAPDELAGTDLDYPSILKSLAGDPVDHTLYLLPRYENAAVTSKHRQIRTDRFKLIYVPTREGVRFHLYDVKSDPGNTQDLFGREGYEKISEELKRRLFEWMLRGPGTGLDGKLHLIQRYTFFE
jgi:arylsulfatase A-like enzyme